MANFNREKTTDDLNTSAYFKKFLWIKKTFYIAWGWYLLFGLLALVIMSTIL